MFITQPPCATSELFIYPRSKDGLKSADTTHCTVHDPQGITVGRIFEVIRKILPNISMPVIGFTVAMVVNMPVSEHMKKQWDDEKAERKRKQEIQIAKPEDNIRIGGSET